MEGSIDKQLCEWYHENELVQRYNPITDISLLIDLQTLNPNIPKLEMYADVDLIVGLGGESHDLCVLQQR